MWVCSFPFLGASGNKDTHVPMQGVFSFLSPGTRATFVRVLPAVQVAAQALVTNIICKEEWDTTVRTSLPLDSSKMKLVYHGVYTSNSLGGYSSVYLLGQLEEKVPRNPLKSKNRAPSRLDKEDWFFWGEIWFSLVTWFSASKGFLFIYLFFINQQGL